MRLKDGEAAKSFRAEDLQGNVVSLEDFRGKKLLLSFFRYASCPLCNLRVHHLIARYPSLQEKGLDILAFFESPKESILEYVGKQQPPFPLIPDPERKVYALYGVEASWLAYLKAGLKIHVLIDAARKGFKPGKMEGKLAMVPADFLIGPDLTVRRAFYGRDISDHMPLEEIERFVG